MTRAQLKAVPSTQPAPLHYAIGGAALENFDRSRYQSARTVAGTPAPLPYTEAQAWAEALERVA